MDAAAAGEVAAIAGEYGGLDYARGRAREYADRAHGVLAGFADGPIRSTLELAVEYVLDRRH
jgi:geranylgeranyl pyrophosphate synthase